MTVTGEIMAGVAALLGAATVAAMSGAYFQRTFSLELDTAIRGTAARIDKVNTLRSLTFAVISKQQAAFVFATLDEGNSVERSAREWEQSWNELKRLHEELRPLLTDHEGAELEAKLQGLLIDYEPVAKEYLRLCRGGFLMEVSALTGKVAGFGTENDRLGREFRDIQMQRLQDAREHADELRVGSEEQTRGIQQVAQAITRNGAGDAAHGRKFARKRFGSSRAGDTGSCSTVCRRTGDGDGRFRGLRVRKLPATLAARSTIAKQ